jgi:GTP-binding protein
VADSGANGASSRKNGRKGVDLTLSVPVGTLILDQSTNAVLADLAIEGATFVVAQGGQGGRGNTHFATSANRTPRVAEPGRLGEDRAIRLELKLIADVGLIGLPNAGKSSLLTALTAARPKVAPYPFTTLDPQLGVVDPESGTRMVLADMPGLIEGASVGVGLGLRFLRHIERTRVLLYVVDGAEADPWANLEMVRREIATYSPEMARRPSLYAINKIDLAATQALRRRTRRKGLHFVSALTREGLDALKGDLLATLAGLTPVEDSEAGAVTIQLPTLKRQDASISVERHPWGFEVVGRRVQILVDRTDFDSEPALDRFQVILDRIGVNAALEDAGVAPGDTIRIGELEFEYQP